MMLQVLMHGPPHFSRGKPADPFFGGSFMVYRISRVIFWGVLQHGSAIEHHDVSGNGASKWGTHFWQVEKGVGEVEKGVRKAEKWVRKAEKAMHMHEAYEKAVSTWTQTVPLAPVITQTSER